MFLGKNGVEFTSSVFGTGGKVDEEQRQRSQKE